MNLDIKKKHTVLHKRNNGNWWEKTRQFPELGKTLNGKVVGLELGQWG